MGEVNWILAPETFDTPDDVPSVAFGKTRGNNWSVMQEGGGSRGDKNDLSSGAVRRRCCRGSPISPPATVALPPSPSFSFQVPTSPSLSVLVPIGNSSHDKKCARLPASVDTQGDSDHLAYHELRDLCRTRGFARADSGAALKKRLSTIDAVEGKRIRHPADSMDASDESPMDQEKLCRVRDLRAAIVADKEIAGSLRNCGAPR